MAPIDIHIKHAGKTYDLKLDPDLPPAVFKDSIYSVTGIPTDRMKVMVKGGVLKDDSSWKKIGPKEGQTFMVIGAAGELPKAPVKPIVFLEDMDDSELAEALAKPVGLRNLGNTCYMNATVQALRAVPELQVALNAPALQSSTALPGALRDLYHNMNSTTDDIIPNQFLDVLREVNPQFAEQDRSEKSGLAAAMGKARYAQQDAEECYGEIIQTLRNVPGLNDKGESTGTGAAAAANRTTFVEQYFMGEMRRELTCTEDKDLPEDRREAPTLSVEKVSKVECNISSSTSFMLSGIINSLDTEVEKNSPSLGRQAIYHQKSRISRLPSYLTVHMVRFAWKADISKKAKIMRQVKFPQEFDALDLTTDELKKKLLPASRKLKEIEKERAERRKVRKRTKQTGPAPGPSATPAAADGSGGDVEMADASTTPAAASAVTPAGTAEEDKGKGATSEEDYSDETVFRKREAAELSQLINEDVKKDIGSSATGLYELVAIITHKGPAADAGHYMAFVKKSVFNAYKKKKENSGLPPSAAVSVDGQPVNPSAVSDGQPGSAPQSTTADIDAAEEDEDWYKFDDEKVTVFPVEKLATLDGGGEDSSAYVLLYRSKNA